jgi:hypothetical protein
MHTKALLCFVALARDLFKRRVQIISDNRFFRTGVFRVARFFLVQKYQNGKNIPNDRKPYKTTINYSILNDSKLFQMAIKYTNIFHSKALHNLPKLGFLV